MFKLTVLGNYLADFNETYTFKKGGYVKLTYQFSGNFKLSQNMGKFKFRRP